MRNNSSLAPEFSGGAVVHIRASLLGNNKPIDKVVHLIDHVSRSKIYYLHFIIQFDNQTSSSITVTWCGVIFLWFQSSPPIQIQNDLLSSLRKTDIFIFLRRCYNLTIEEDNGNFYCVCCYLYCREPFRYSFLFVTSKVASLSSSLGLRLDVQPILFRRDFLLS